MQTAKPTMPKPIYFLFFLLLSAGCACAQTTSFPVRRDSLPGTFPPDFMPNARSSNSFYRSRLDPPNVMRATLDNMPVKIPDSSTNYSILHPPPRFRRRTEPPMPFLKPMPRVWPGRP